MMKRFLCGLVALLISISLVSCSSQDKEVNSSSGKGEVPGELKTIAYNEEDLKSEIIGDIQYSVPNEWETEKVDNPAVYWLEGDIILLVYNEDMSKEKAVNLTKENESYIEDIKTEKILLADGTEAIKHYYKWQDSSETSTKYTILVDSKIGSVKFNFSVDEDDKINGEEFIDKFIKTISTSTAVDPSNVKSIDGVKYIVDSMWTERENEDKTEVSYASKSPEFVVLPYKLEFLKDIFSAAQRETYLSAIEKTYENYNLVKLEEKVLKSGVKVLRHDYASDLDSLLQVKRYSVIVNSKKGTVCFSLMPLAGDSENIEKIFEWFLDNISYE